MHSGRRGHRLAIICAVLILLGTVSGCAKGGSAYVFYTCFDGKTHSVHRMDLNGGDVRTLNSAYSHFVNVYDGWVYYWNVDTGRVFKMRLDGSDTSQLNDEASDYVNVSNGWVYYVNTGDSQNIYRIKVDGSSRQKLTDFPPPTPDQPGRMSSLYVIGDAVYYRGFAPEAGDALFRLDCDGKNAAVLDASR